MKYANQTKIKLKSYQRLKINSKTFAIPILTAMYVSNKQLVYSYVQTLVKGQPYSIYKY